MTNRSNSQRKVPERPATKHDIAYLVLQLLEHCMGMRVAHDCVVKPPKFAMKVENDVVDETATWT